MNLLVVGSINMDIVNYVHTYPSPGQTINSTNTLYYPGGKGANQAVAASLSGANVKMVGAIGTDVFAKELTTSLNSFRVQTGTITCKEGATGIAFITVVDQGENSIILSSGANGKLLPDDIKKHQELFAETNAVLLQNEIPWETTRHAMELAKQSGAVVFFNPAPARALPDDVLAYIDWLVINETEAEVISGQPVNYQNSALHAAELLLEKGVRKIVITLGTNGLIYLDNQGQFIQVPAFRVSPVDTTGAGDTFIGSLATSIMEENDIQKALTFASAAAAISVTRHGAQNSMPNREEIERFLKQQS
ncbi:ribokinase [Neobacillus sp. Marseille-QA0830]